MRAELPPGANTVKRDSVGVMWVRLQGFVTAADVIAAVGAVRRETELINAYVIDCQDVEGYEPGVSSPGKDLLRELKARGAARGVCITGSSVVRMMASAVAFVMGMPVRFAATRAEAQLALARIALVGNPPP